MQPYYEAPYIAKDTTEMQESVSMLLQSFITEIESDMKSSKRILFLAIVFFATVSSTYSGYNLNDLFFPSFGQAVIEKIVIVYSGLEEENFFGFEQKVQAVANEFYKCLEWEEDTIPCPNDYKKFIITVTEALIDRHQHHIADSLRSFFLKHIVTS